jgi:site-specific DNA recombinase
VRVGLYARVSTERQQERGTVASQLVALRAAAQSDGHEIVEEFVDEGYSGARLDRPALDRLRDAAEAGVLDGVLCLCADRLARAYAYQVLILEELERFDVTVQFLEGPALGADPQSTLLVQMQGVIAEYERAKIAERYRRGKLYRARAGEICFWKMSYGHRHASTEQGGWRIEISEPEAQVVRAIFRAYADERRSMRQIAHDLHDRGVPSPTGKPTWGVSTLGRLLHNEAYIGTVYYNRRESLDGNGPRGTRTRKTRYRERPREEWIAITVPAIIDPDTFARSQQVSRENPKWNPRGAEPGAWLLRGLIECGHCGVGANCHKMRGRNGTHHRYYYCRNHDILRAGGEQHRCPERNIRANELDDYVFQQVRQALLDPRQLIAGERAVITSTPLDENELIANQLTRLSSALQATERERTRLLDAYQAELLDLDELTRRTAKLTTRRHQLTREKDTLTERSAELASENRLRRGLAHFAERVAASLDELDFDARQHLLRLIVERVRVTGWHVEIHLKIPLADDDPGDDRAPRTPSPNGPSSDMGLRSLGAEDLGVVDEAVDHRGGGDLVAEDLTPRGEGLVGGDDQAGAFVAAADEHEHQVRGLGVEGDVADLVDDHQWDALELVELGVEAAVASCVGEQRDPFGRGAEQDALAGEAGADGEGDREEASMCCQEQMPRVRARGGRSVVGMGPAASRARKRWRAT